MPSRKLDPAVPGVDGFYEFFALRQEAWWARRLNPNCRRPSKDWALANHHFPNVYRELDPGTIWFQKQVAGKTPVEVYQTAVVYRLLNRRQTFEAYGLPDINEPLVWLTKLQDARAHGVQLATGRHITPSFSKYHEAVIHVCRHGERDIALIHQAPNVQTVFQFLKEGVPGVSNFFAWQLTCDLLESGVLPFSENQWCCLGPGPMGAVQMICGVRRTAKMSLAFVRQMHAHQRSFLQETSVSFTPPPGIPTITLKNMEHALCEYFRYVRTYWERL